MHIFPIRVWAIPYAMRIPVWETRMCMGIPIRVRDSHTRMGQAKLPIRVWAAHMRIGWPIPIWAKIRVWYGHHILVEFLHNTLHNKIITVHYNTLATYMPYLHHSMLQHIKSLQG